jgi:phosphoribosylaminoimidazolecarboxamide formyltransferase/IMP cyclohydrolase
VGAASILQGKKMGYCNFLDADAALSLSLEFTHQPAAVIIKHATPCGVAVGKDLLEAYSKAFATDPVSAFGGVVALNRRIDRELAERMAEIFYEIIIAPEFSPEALAVFATKPNLRLLSTGSAEPAKGRRDLRSVSGGLLVQDADEAEINPEYLHVENGRLQESETGDVNFAWRVAKHVKSNAIVIAKDGQTLGLGGGQTSRVGAAEIAIRQAGDKARGAVAASDAFFPFPDGVELLADAGISIIVQPGGSKNDEAVFEAAKKRGIRMVLTGVRAFKH